MRASGGFIPAPAASTSVAWADVNGKPASFPPSAHTHPWSDITSIPVAFSPTAHTHPWSDITAKPATFAPSAHTHLWADITDKPAAFPPATHTHSGLLTLIGTATVGETLVLGLSLGVKRYSVAMAGAAVGDRLMLALTGAPQNGTLQDAYVSATNTVSIGLLLPALGIGTVIAVPLAIYKVAP